ncbi:hypothetical protein [Glycomyces tarimensis]
MTPQPLSAVALLACVETMPIGRRTRFLSAYAREHGGGDAFADLLAELAGRDHFAADLSLFLASVAGDREHVGALAGRDDCEIAAAAVAVAARLGGFDDAIVSTVLDGALQVRRSAYRALRRNRREAVADRLLGAVRERFGDREAARLLSACSGPVVAEALPSLAHAVASWATLARRHPDVFADYASQSLAELPRAQWTQWWAHHRRGLRAAASARPEVWLALFDRCWEDQTLPEVLGPVLPRLITANPDEAWRFVLSPERETLVKRVCFQQGVLRRLTKRDTAAIAAFARRSRSLRQIQAMLLPLLPHPRRREVLLACQGDYDGDRWHGFSRDLPRSLRHEVVRERLAHRKVADSRAQREALRGQLPYGEVRDELVAATERTSAAERATAYERLVQSAGLDGSEAVADMLAALDRLGRDQDQVHAAALEALTAVPATAWRREHRAPLSALIGAVLGSPWRSRETNQALLRLASRFIRIGLDHRARASVEFGLEHLARVAVECGSRDLAGALRKLPRPVVAELCRRLIPVMSGQCEVGRFKLVLVFAKVLDRTCRDLPELGSLLRAVARSGETVAARDAAAALARADPAAAAELVEADAALATVPAVFEVLIRDRVDTLADWLSSPGDDVSALLRPRGRHLTRRWPAGLRERYLTTLDSLANDERRSTRERAMIVTAMSRVPGAPIGRFEAHLETGHQALSASALAALDTAVPVERAWEVLMEHANGPNAVVAGLGLGRLARRARPAFLAERIAPVLESEKLAARKQGVRLMLDHRVPGAEGAVRSLWSDETLSAGVRAAIVSGLLHWLDEPWARRIVRESVGFGADVAAAALTVAPFAIAPEHRSEYGNLLADAAVSGDERLIEAALPAAAQWSRYSTYLNDALVDLFSDLDATAHWTAAAAALRAIAVEAGDWEPLLTAVRRLRSDDRVEPNATAERDSPVRQRLGRVVDSLKMPWSRHSIVDRLPDGLIELLPVDLGTQLLLAALPWDAPAWRIRALTARIGDAVEAYQLGLELARRLQQGQRADFLPFYERLASTGDIAACVIAASTIQIPGAGAGWTPEWRELLRRLRAFPAPEVARLARGVYTSGE